MLPAFSDPRYLRVDGKPLFMVYRPRELPSAAAFADQWRELASKAGLPGLYLVGEDKGGWRAAGDGFDADLHPPLFDVPHKRLLPGRVGMKLDPMLRWKPRTHPYADIAAQPRIPSRLPHPDLPMVLTNWDNTPRLGRRGLVLTGATPERFGGAMGRAVEAVQALPTDQRIVFVKSWNEWAEGNYIEPDRRHGHGFLRALQQAVAAPKPS